MMHKHDWKDVSFDHVWTYPSVTCQYGTSYSVWENSKRYQKENPGVQIITGCRTFDHDEHSRYADSETIIHQKCDCGNYREQYIDGILKLEDDVECKEEHNSVLKDKLKK